MTHYSKGERMKFKVTTPYALVACTVLAAFGIVGFDGTGGAAPAATVANYRPPPAKACQGKTMGEADISTTISFLVTLDNSMVAEGNRLGMKVTVLGANLDNATEVNNINDLISRKVDVIGVTSSSPTAVVPAVTRSWAAKIPVIAVNAPLASSAKVITYDGDSNYQYGRSIGKLILRALPKGGKIAVLKGVLGDSVATQRLNGINQVIRSHKDIKIVSSMVDNFDNSTALADTQDLLSKYPKGTLQAIVATGPEIFVGANYAKVHGRTDLKFIGGDYPTQVQASIKSGAMYGSVDQSPVQEGTLAVDYACNYLLGQVSSIPRPTALVPLPVVTKANVTKVAATWSD